MADVELPITGHLEELRGRLLRAVLTIAVGFAIAYPLSAQIFDFLTEPIFAAAVARGDKVQLIGTGVAEAFFTRVKVSFIAGLFLALPVILYQGWQFVLPGLKPEEAKSGRAFVAVGTFFFFLGATFCYEVIFTFGYPFFLAEYASINIEPVIRISEYLSFTARLLFAFGITFELPVVTYFLARVGVVTHTMLIKQARYAVLVIFVIAAMLTPPDVVSQVLMAAPLMILYGVSIFVAYWVGRD